MFGFRSDVASNVAYAEDGAVVFPAGHNIVLYSPDVRTQRLIPGTLESEGISAMAVSLNKKLLAVAERSDKAIITVYDLQTLKRRKVLVAPDVGSKVRVAERAAGSTALFCGCTHTCVLRARACIHAHARTYTHTYHIHTRTHTHRASTHTDACAYTYTRMHTHPSSRAHTHPH